MTTSIAAPRRTPLLRRMGLALATAAATLLAACTTTPAAAPKSDIGLYELRIYTAAEGKMDALNARFRDHTVGLFKKHGMTPIGFWTVAPPAAGQPVDNRLFYIMGYKDRAARDAAWTAFGADPDWRAVFTASQANGSLTAPGGIASVFLTPAEYFQQVATNSAPTPRHFELRTYKAAPGKLENVHARFRDNTIRIFNKHGMTSVGYWRPVEGQADMADKMLYMLAFPDAATRGTAWRAFATDPEWSKVAQESEKDGPILAQPGAIVSVQLTPTDYSPLK